MIKKILCLVMLINAAQLMGANAKSAETPDSPDYYLKKLKLSRQGQASKRFTVNSNRIFDKIRKGCESSSGRVVKIQEEDNHFDVTVCFLRPNSRPRVIVSGDPLVGGYRRNSDDSSMLMQDAVVVVYQIGKQGDPLHVHMDHIALRSMDDYNEKKETQSMVHSKTGTTLRCSKINKALVFDIKTG